MSVSCKCSSAHQETENFDWTDVFLFPKEFNFIAQTLPDTITELQNLNYLLLDRNLLVGSIPSQLNKLTNLQVFYVFSNGLSGTLPPDIGSIPTLTSIVAYGK